MGPSRQLRATFPSLQQAVLRDFPAASDPSRLAAFCTAPASSDSTASSVSGASTPVGGGGAGVVGGGGGVNAHNMLGLWSLLPPRTQTQAQQGVGVGVGGGLPAELSGLTQLTFMQVSYNMHLDCMQEGAPNH